MAVAFVSVMTSNAVRQTLAHSHPVIRWVFQRDANTITCGLDVRSRRSYEVCLIPHWDVSSSSIEQFGTPAAALMRHAEIARRLREHGWMLTGYVPVTPASAAA